MNEFDQIILDIAVSNLTDYANIAKEHWKIMVRKYLIENANVATTVTLKLTDNWVEFNLRYVVDYKKRRATRHILFSEIHEVIKKTDGKVRLASATFEVTDLPQPEGRSGEENRGSLSRFVPNFVN